MPMLAGQPGASAPAGLARRSATQMQQQMQQIACRRPRVPQSRSLAPAAKVWAPKDKIPPGRLMSTMKAKSTAAQRSGSNMRFRSKLATLEDVNSQPLSPAPSAP